MIILGLFELGYNELVISKKEYNDFFDSFDERTKNLLGIVI